MVLPDLNDTEYLTHVTMAAGKLEHLIKKSLKRQTEGFSDILKDNTIPWPIRMYYILDDHKFV